jgi:hypothetical protein
MKIFLLSIYFIFGIQFSQAQYWLPINFEQPSPNIKNDTNPGNIWQIGQPSKTVFDSAYSVPNAIVTDTLLPYPVNNHSSFIITIKAQEWFWGSPSSLSFFHRFNTDSGNDGGYIDVSYNGGVKWQNIIYDTILTSCPMYPYVDSLPWLNNMYTKSDTINGGIPAFTGNSNGWQQSSITWLFCLGVKTWPPDSVMFRFNFISDSLQTNKDGWMVDNITFNSSICSGVIQANGNNKFQSRISPNPSQTQALLQFDNPLNQSFNLNIYNEFGNQIYTANTSKNYFLIPSIKFNKGYYTYQLYSEKKLSTGKFIVE